MDKGPRQNKNRNLSETIQSVEARKELEELFNENISKINSQDGYSEMEDLFKRRESERERERENYYMTRGERKRSAQKHKERLQAAAVAAQTRKEEKAKQKAKRKEIKEKRKADKKALKISLKERSLEMQNRIAEETKSEKSKKKELSNAPKTEKPSKSEVNVEERNTETFSKQDSALLRDIKVKKNAGEVAEKKRSKKRNLFFFEKDEDDEEPVRRREGFFHRIIRFLKTVLKRRKKMKGKCYYSAEKKRAVYGAILSDCFSPVTEGWEDFLETSWNFICLVGQDSLAICIFLYDSFLKMVFYIWTLVLIVWDLIWDARYWIEANKDEFLKKFVIFVFSIAGLAIIWGTITAYEYVYYGNVLGIAKSPMDVYKTIEVLGDKLSEASGANVSLDVERDIEFRRVIGLSLDIDTDDDILNTLTYMKDLQVRAYGIFIDDKMVVVLENEKTAMNMLKSIQDSYAGAKEGVEYTSISFKEKVTVQEVGVQLGEIWHVKDAEYYLKTGSKVERKHTVAQGETFGEIASTYGLTVNELSASNPGVNTNKIYVGQSLSLSYAAPLITLTSTEVATYDERISYGTQYIDNASIYKGETEVKSRGIYGQQRLVAEVVRINGIEISREILSSEKLSDPVDEVLYRGTKPIPPKEGTGTFAYPIRTYTITSRFGMRWGSLHTGVDFGAGTGTKIYASDGGTVTFAGWKGTYGYLIIISHGSLYETYYAHCSKLLVGVGDKIYQGQNIALVGSTGRSTGPHLHFEIRYNDTPKNPLDFL
ncbi:MAG: LysM peptidoglycan-binding domain-containing protein [Clostridia bacterium]|nr:LysM peptidoglycan-binding domain-containing protein [Clostridia bacterium]